MKFTIKTLGLTLGAALVCGAVGLAATEGNGRHDGRGQRRLQRIERREFVRSLHFTDGQRAQALASARAVRPTVEAARAEAKKIISDARAANPTGDREAIRATVKDRIQALRASARTQVEPNARALAATLTPEQRQKLQDRAAAHGRTFDENRFVARLGHMLARPRAVEFLERRQAR